MYITDKLTIYLNTEIHSYMMITLTYLELLHMLRFRYIFYIKMEIVSDMKIVSL